MIYILDNNPKKTAEMLDDKSLDRMIRDIAQVLCDAYWLEESIERYIGTKDPEFSLALNGQEIPPLKFKDKSKWSQWARECLANYKYLVGLGTELLREWMYRTQSDKRFDEMKEHKMHAVIQWASDNQPDLPLAVCTFANKNLIKGTGIGEYYADTSSPTPFPLVMPKKYQDELLIEYHLIQTEADIDIGLDILFYRNYYQAKVSRVKCYRGSRDIFQKPCCTQHVTWTRREKPEWVRL